MINLDSIKDHIVHIRDTNIWWMRDESAEMLIKKAGGRIAIPDEGNETITLFSYWPHYRQIPTNENLVHENLFWPECIKQAFPDFLDQCIKEYYVVGSIICFSKEEALETLEGLIDDGEETVTIEHCDASYIDKPSVCYTFNNEDSFSTEGTFYAFEDQSHLDIFLDQISYTSHQIFFQLQ